MWVGLIQSGEGSCWIVFASEKALTLPSVLGQVSGQREKCLDLGARIPAMVLHE